MKKQIIGILAVLSCLACLGGCLEDTSLNTNKPGYSINSTSQGSEAGTSEDSESTETPAVNFKAVKAILKGMYDQEIYSNNNVDFEVVKMIPNVLGVDYTLSWSVDVTEGVVLQDKGDVVKVNVDEASTEPINYVLTATITAPDGSTDTQNFRFTVKAISQYVTAAIKGKPAENTAYKFHVYQSSLQTDLYFAGAMDGYYFKTTDKSEEAADIYVEYVTGSETNFNLYFFKDTVDETTGEKIEDVKHYIGMRVSEDGGHNNIVFDAKGPVSEFYWSDTYNTIITMLEKDRDGNSNVEFYLGNYGTLKTISGSVASQHFGKEGNNVGELVGLVDRTQIPDAEKVADTVKTLGLKSSYQCDAEVELPERGTTYPEALVSWTCDSELVTINDNTMTFAPVTEATEVTLVATVTCGNESKTTEVKISIMTALPADGSTLTIPEALAIGKNLTEDTTQKYYVSGKITSFYGSSGTTYGNVNIEDADGNTILVYGLFNEDGTVRYDKLENKPVVGDTIKVYGVLTQFNGTAQFKNAWIIEHVAGEGGEGGGEDVADAYTLSFADKAQRTTFTDEQQIWEQNGVKVTNNKSTGTTNVADYANPARFYKGSEVIIEYAGMTKIVIASEGTASGKNYLDFLTQSLPTGTSFTVEGTTVTIVLLAAQDSYTFTCTAGQVRMYSITVYTGEVEGGGEVTPPEGGEDETPTTPEEILNALYALADGESLTGEFTLTGKITALDNYNNPTIVVEGFENKPVYCYKLKVENAVGDTITVTATSMKNYMGTYEFMNCTLVTGGGEVTPPEGGEGEEPTLTMVTSIVEGKPYHFSFSQSDGVTYYFAGKLNSQGFYLQGTTDLAASVPVYLEAATNAGEYYVYFMDGNAKTYIEMYVSGTHINPQLVTSTPATTYKYDTTYNTITCDINDGTFFYGSRADRTFDTFSCTDYNKYITTNYVAHFFTETEGGEGGGEVTPPEGGEDETPTTPEEILNALYALADGESLTGEFTLTGKITALDNYNNPTIVVEGFENKPVYCYKLKVENAVGDTITVTATSMKNYMGTYEFMNCTLVTGGGEVTPPEGGEDETPTTPEEILKAAYALANNETLANMTLTGVVTNVKQTGEGEACLTFVVEGFDQYPMYCYWLKGAEAGNLAVGDTITVTGTIKNYNGTIEYDKANLDSFVKGEQGGEVTPPAACEHDYVDGVCSKCGEADPDYVPEAPVVGGGQADFNTIVTSNANGDSSYKNTYTTTNGWTTVNSAIQSGGSSVSNPQFPIIGADNTFKAVCLNGKVGAAGVLTSPTLTGGISKLTINYTKMFTDTKLGFKVTITDLKTNAIYTKEVSVELSKDEKYVIYTLEWVLETAIEGNFTIVIENTCPSANTSSNKDRLTLLSVVWEASAAGGEGGGEVTPPAACEHKYEAVVTDPTCTENGYTTYTCSVCGDSYTADEVTTNGHSYETVVTAPTCTENGYTTYTCSICGDSYTADEVTTNGHSYETVVTDPTCTENGYTTYTCSVCGDSYTADEVNATGHADENEDYKCDACSTVLEPAADSTLTVAQAVKLANALGIGKYSTNKYYMTVIIESIYNTQYGNANVKDANGDKYVIYGMYLDGTRYDKLTYKPVAGDEVTFYAAVGSYSSSSYQMKSADIIEIVAHEHAYTSVVTEPTCTADGYTTHTCSICQASYTDAETVATGHSTEEGVCEYCGKTIGGDAPAEPEVLATFDFGANGTATHVDGNDLGASKSYTVGSYTLSLTSMSKVYGPAYDAKGNSCLKLGTSKVVGTFTFTVPENVSTVYIYVAKYKANTTKITINGGTAQTLTCASNNGEYDKIEVDTSTNKNVTFATASGGVRAMVNTIEFVGLPA